MEALLEGSLSQFWNNNTLIEPTLSLIIMTAAAALFIFVLIAVVTSTNDVEAFRTAVRRFLKPPDTTTSTTTSATKTTTPTPASSSSSPLDNSFRWWEELAPPFRLKSDVITEDDDLLPEMDADITHFCFLIHGHRGLSKDLSYVQHVMRRVAATEKRKRWVQYQEQEDMASVSSSSPIPSLSSSSSLPLQDAAAAAVGGGDSGGDSDSGEEKEAPEVSDFLRHDMVVHSVCCNEGKTTDGVVKGGDRVVEEIMNVIRQEMEIRQSPEGAKSGGIRDVTISILGNSLGGIYGRYAIAKLTERCKRESEGCYILDGKFRLMMNIFCTTATPHLGVAGHTFVPLPRSAEIGVAHAMGDTGKDLFRLNDLLKTMATSPEFLEPLGSFRKRIAYANAFGTDFPVPAQTAAFLNEASTYPHHFLDDDNLDPDQDGDQLVVDDNGLVIAILHTPVKDKDESKEDSATEVLEPVEQNATSELVQMSTSLDALGWKKVFIDVRKEMPNIAIPKSFRRLNINGTNSNNSSGTPGDGEMDDSSERLRQIDLLRQRGVVGSRDVAAAVTAPMFEEKLHWPVGHNMMVAFSRSRWSTYMNKGGRPVVDSLAKELVQDIFTWNNNTSTQRLGINDQ
jgi:hypothetical protein